MAADEGPVIFGPWEAAASRRRLRSPPQSSSSATAEEEESAKRRCIAMSNPERRRNNAIMTTYAHKQSFTIRRKRFKSLPYKKLLFRHHDYAETYIVKNTGVAIVPVTTLHNRS